MKMLKEISEGSLGLSDLFEQLRKNYELRKSARAILLNAEGKMAVQYLRTYTFHKLPGGGIEPGEKIEDALKREVLEEVGCACSIVRPVGMTIEYRKSSLHISYAYIAKVEGEIGTPTLEQIETEEGQETLWLSPEEALAKMEKDLPKKPEGHFILEREKAFLKEYLAS